MNAPDHPRRLHTCLAGAALLLGACGESENSTPPPPPPPARTWALGFAATPPVFSAASVLQGIDLWSQRAEYAVIHEELPWTDLLAGMTPAEILQRDKVDLVDYMRSRGQRLVFLADWTDGLSRAEEAPQLRALSRSLSEPVVQQLARDWVVAVATILQPDYVGLGAETNLIRAVAPPALYDAVVAVSNAAAADLAAVNDPAVRFFSVQVETAWGHLPPGPFRGIAQDLLDFPFAEAIGLSSYPYFAFDDPDRIPVDYYRRVLEPTMLPAFVAEGGWTSADVGVGTSSPAKQARYIARQEELLDGIDALLWLHLLFADPDLSTWPQPQPVNLPLFTNIGLTNSDFSPKPALAVWDELFARPLVGHGM